MVPGILLSVWPSVGRKIVLIDDNLVNIGAYDGGDSMPYPIQASLYDNR